jgi:hypothetical protein
MALQIFLIAGLLADQHQRRAGRAFAEHGLRRELVKVAARAAARLERQQLQRLFRVVDTPFTCRARAEERKLSRRLLRHHWDAAPGR